MFIVAAVGVHLPPLPLLENWRLPLSLYGWPCQSSSASQQPRPSKDLKLNHQVLECTSKTNRTTVVHGKVFSLQLCHQQSRETFKVIKDWFFGQIESKLKHKSYRYEDNNVHFWFIPSLLFFHKYFGTLSLKTMFDNNISWNFSIMKIQSVAMFFQLFFKPKHTFY